jgi:hypothetical protein
VVFAAHAYILQSEGRSETEGQYERSGFVLEGDNSQHLLVSLNRRDDQAQSSSREPLRTLYFGHVDKAAVEADFMDLLSPIGEVLAHLHLTFVH